MTQLEMFGQNIFLILGTLLLLAFGSVVLAVVWTGLRASLFVIRQRRAQRVYRQRSRRADGKMYPPIISGVCDGCGRASKVYYAESGEKLCATCYEASWRQAE